MHDHPEPPPEAWSPLWRATKLVRRPLERFLQQEAASGVVLVLTAALALVWANSPWRASYAALWHLPLRLDIGSLSLARPLEWLVNDGLMAVFFFVVGLEIRREIHAGELSEWRRAALPLAAACGGMLIPAGLAVGFMHGTPASRGWAIPMATDIAFAVGVLTLLGPRVPPALRVLLLALAVIDDLGGILVIATFYTERIVLAGLATAAAGLLAIFVLQALGVRRKLAYAGVALAVWVGTCVSGVHPTLAGVAIGLATPVRRWQQRESPCEELIEALHPWVAFVIMPVFALANAGITLGDAHFDGPGVRAALGIGVGLVLGKPLGVVLVCAVLLRLRVVRLPTGLDLRHVLVLGLVAGIGFTMSLFIAQLAYGSAAWLGASKLAILAASVTAALIALAAGRMLLPARPVEGAAQSESEAEASTLL